MEHPGYCRLATECIIFHRASFYSADGLESLDFLGFRVVKCRVLEVQDSPVSSRFVQTFFKLGLEAGLRLEIRAWRPRLPFASLAGASLTHTCIEEAGA